MAKNTKVTTIETPAQNGQWHSGPHGTLCVVDVPPQMPHVACWPHPPGAQPTGLPYALFFDDVGDVMLQLPPKPGVRKDPLTLPISEVVKLIDSARDFCDTVEHDGPAVKHHEAE